jgi:predicted transposase YdaD
MGMLKNEWSHDLELEAREDYGAEKKALEIAKNLLAKGMEPLDVAEVTGLTIDQILRLKSQ